MGFGDLKFPFADCNKRVSKKLKIIFVVAIVRMLKARNAVLIALSAALTGCKIERHVTIDFANPMFDLHCGPVVLIAFAEETVLHVGTTYFMLSLPFYIPLAFLVALFVGL